ncbi:hypothetical protein AVEN_181259-1, partial [Araneus ventricosus]
ADLDFRKEASDMGCEHQQMKFPAPWTFGKINDIIERATKNRSRILCQLFSVKSNVCSLLAFGLLFEGL